MKKRLLSSVVLTPLLVVALLVSSSACGTIANFVGGPKRDSNWPVPIPYGGIVADLQQPTWEKADEWTASDVATGAPLLLLDLSLSAILDTVTLPVVLWLDVEYLVKRWTTKDPNTQSILPPIVDQAELPRPAVPPTGLPTPAESLLKSKPTK